MKMTLRQEELYNKGVEYSKRYDYINQAYWSMDLKELEDVTDSKWSAFFEAGFYGREPEWVQAIRYGEIPESGYSINWAEGTRESGVSCVKIIRQESDRDYKSIYDITLGGQGFEKITVEGWYFGGTGSDGEPLLIGARKTA